MRTVVCLKELNIFSGKLYVRVEFFTRTKPREAKSSAEVGVHLLQGCSDKSNRSRTVDHPGDACRDFPGIEASVQDILPLPKT